MMAAASPRRETARRAQRAQILIPFAVLMKLPWVVETVMTRLQKGQSRSSPCRAWKGLPHPSVR